MERSEEFFNEKKKFEQYIKGDVPYSVKALYQKLYDEYINSPQSKYMTFEASISDNAQLSSSEKEIILEYAHYSSEANFKFYVIEKMKDAYFSKGYSMIIDDIVQQLDLDEKYIRSTILPELDYFQAPPFSSEFFVWGIGLDFLELTRKRSKRVFINVDSYNRYIEEHLFVQCPSVRIRYNEYIGRYEAAELLKSGKAKIDYVEIPYKTNFNLSFIKTTSVHSIIRDKKRAALLRTVKRNIISAYRGNRITEDELKEQMKIACEEITTVPVQVYDKEIADFINGSECFKVSLSPDLEDRKEKTIVLCGFEEGSRFHCKIEGYLLEKEIDNLTK